MEDAKRYAAAGMVPVMLDPAGEPVQRNFIHLSDLVEVIVAALGHPKAHQELFNVCMDEPVNYREVAEYLKASRGIDSVDVATEFHRTWLDNSKAKFLLGWRPQVGLQDLIDGAWDYERGPDDPRKIWYPG